MIGLDLIEREQIDYERFENAGKGQQKQESENF